MRGAVYSVAFLVVMLVLGLIQSRWAILALPAALLIGFAFAALGMAADTFMRTLADFDFDRAGDAADVPVLARPSSRSTTTRRAIQWSSADPAVPRRRPDARAHHRDVGPFQLVHALYLAAMGPSACRPSRRLDKLLLK